MPSELDIMAPQQDEPEGWPRDDVADHHEERCVGCNVELGPGRVLRLFTGFAWHPICWDPPARPPVDEVQQLWDGCISLAPYDGAHIDFVPALDAARYLNGRGLLRGVGGMVRVLAAGAECPPWARYGSRSWAETGHRLIVPVYDHAGRMRLVRGWRWQDDDSPKRLAAAGYSVKGLVMAGGLGLALLRGELPSWMTRPQVLIVEGEPDCLRATLEWPDWCVLGIAPGCWCEELAGRIPAGSRVSIQTDPDEAGDKYADLIGESLRARCQHIARAKPGAEP